MPTTITRIQKTRLGRFSLYGEEGFLFSLDSETYFSCGVEEGDILTDNDLAALREKSDARKAKDRKGRGPGPHRRGAGRGVRRWG